MIKKEKLFYSISDSSITENIDMTLGKMMSSPGIKYKNKVFAFYYKDRMVFCLGKDFDPRSKINYLWPVGLRYHLKKI